MKITISIKSTAIIGDIFFLSGLAIVSAQAAIPGRQGITPVSAF